MGLLRDTLRNDRFEIHSPHSVDTVVQRSIDVGAAGFSSYFRVKGPPVRGRATAERIVMVKRSRVNNSFRPQLFVAPQSAGPGPCLLRCEIRPAKPVVWLSALWVGLASIGAAACLVLSITEREPVALLGVLFPLYFAGLLAFGGWLARGERDLLRRTIVGVAGAEPVPTSSADRL